MVGNVCGGLGCQAKELNRLQATRDHYWSINLIRSGSQVPTVCFVVGGDSEAQGRIFVLGNVKVL